MSEVARWKIDSGMTVVLAFDYDAIKAERDFLLAKVKALREALDDAVLYVEGELMAVGHMDDGPRRTREMKFLKEKLAPWKAALAEAADQPGVPRAKDSE
jgi:hypothetical protein